MFAKEIFYDASETGVYLRAGMRILIDAKSRMLEHWIADGRRRRSIRPILFAVWTETQPYADLERQLCAAVNVMQIDAATALPANLLPRGGGLAANTGDNHA